MKLQRGAVVKGQRELYEADGNGLGAVCFGCR